MNEMCCSSDVVLKTFHSLHSKMLGKERSGSRPQLPPPQRLPHCQLISIQSTSHGDSHTAAGQPQTGIAPMSSRTRTQSKLCHSALAPHHSPTRSCTQTSQIPIIRASTAQCALCRLPTVAGNKAESYASFSSLYKHEIILINHALIIGFEENMRKIPSIPPPRSTLKLCPDPISAVTQSQLAVLDPTGARTRLFADSNAERVQPGDILHVRLKSGDPVSGVCLVIRKRNSPIDTSILLRNQLTRVAVEVWFKVYSPNVEGIEIVQRKAKRARRAKLYYMRNPKHDVGSVENIVRQYLRNKAGGSVGSKEVKGRDANSGRRKVSGKKKR